jgi:hypothetical protein
MMPWEFAELDARKKAALIAMIQIRVEDEKKEAEKMKKSMKKR